MQAALPEDIRLRFEFDQSPYVTRAMGAWHRRGSGAVLTGLMVLLFLRDWRSVVVVVLNIPFALLARSSRLWLSGQTINLMTLGGLALAVGILVDEATVAVENIHTQMERPANVALAVWHGDHRDGRAALAGDAVHPGGVPAGGVHGGGGPRNVRPAVAGGRVLDDRVLLPVQHVRPGAVGLAAQVTCRRPCSQAVRAITVHAYDMIQPTLQCFIANLLAAGLACARFGCQGDWE